jgi:hypothetical protein
MTLQQLKFGAAEIAVTQMLLDGNSVGDGDHKATIT